MCVESVFTEEMMKGQYGFLSLLLALLQERRRRRLHHCLTKFDLFPPSLSRAWMTGIWERIMKTEPFIMVWKTGVFFVKFDKTYTGALIFPVRFIVKILANGRHFLGKFEHTFSKSFSFLFLCLWLGLSRKLGH